MRRSSKQQLLESFATEKNFWKGNICLETFNFQLESQSLRELLWKKWDVRTFDNRVYLDGWCFYKECGDQLRTGDDDMKADENLKRKSSNKEDDEDKVGEESGHINHLKSATLTTNYNI